MSLVFDFSIDKDEVYCSIIDDFDSNLVKENIIELINDIKIESIMDVSDQLIKLAEELHQTSNFDLFTMKDIYTVSSLNEINQIIIHYNKAYIVKLTNNPFNFTYYLMCFDKRDIDVPKFIVNNIDKLRKFIYLVVAYAEVSKQNGK